MSSFLTILIDEPARFSGTDCYRIKLHDKYDDVLVRFLLARIQKKGGG